MRRRRSFILTALLVIGGLGATATGLIYAAKREPEFYSQTPCAMDWENRVKAGKLVTRVQDLKNDIRSRQEWGDTFTAEDLNCFFVENMGKKGGLSGMLPSKCHSPRVAIEGDKLRLGFKYGDGFWSTVVWVELKVWLVAKETNVVAVEVCDLRAGGLAIGSQTILDSISESARDSNIEVTWYRSKSNPVGLFRFYADQPRPSALIRTLEVKDGLVTVGGKSFLDQSSVAAMPLGIGLDGQ